MKIAVFHNLPSGGALRALYQKTRLMEERGWVVSLYSFSTAECRFLPAVPVRGEEHVEPLDFRGPSRFRRYAEASRRVADRINRSEADWGYVDKCRFFGAPPLLPLVRKPTAYYCHEPLGLGEYNVFAGGPPRGDEGVGSRFARLSVRQRLEKLWGLAGRQRIKREDRRSIRAASAVLAPSSFAALWIERVYGVRPVVVYQGVDTGFFSPDPSQKREDLVISVGRIDRNKNHGFAIRALGAIPEESRPRLVVVCDQIDWREKARLDAEGARAGVAWEMRLRISEQDLRSLYRSARAVLCTALREPFGLVPLEAMACGTPVLAARDGGYLESVIDGGTGYILDRDPALWAGKIAACADADLAGRLGAAGRAHTVKHWTWSPFVDRLEKNVLGNLGWSHSQDLRTFPSSASSS